MESECCQKARTSGKRLMGWVMQRREMRRGKWTRARRSSNSATRNREPQAEEATSTPNTTPADGALLAVTFSGTADACEGGGGRVLSIAVGARWRTFNGAVVGSSVPGQEHPNLTTSIVLLVLNLPCEGLHSVADGY